MKLLADENIEHEIITALRASGFEVSSVKEIEPGIDDSSVLDMARDLSSVLLTNDKDSGELIYRDGLIGSGVILLRFGNLPLQERIERLEYILATHENIFFNMFTVVSKQGFRIRKQDQRDP